MTEITETPFKPHFFERQDDSPDVFIAGPDLQDAKQVTKTNPFQDRYAWGHSETIEYKNERGDRLQGGLYYPAGYQAGKRYPMIVWPHGGPASIALPGWPEPTLEPAVMAKVD